MLDSEVVATALPGGGFPAPYDDRLSSVLGVDVRRQRERFQGEKVSLGAGLVAEASRQTRVPRDGSPPSYLELIASPFSVKDIPVLELPQESDARARRAASAVARELRG
jgi:hypothetical protein